MLLFLFFCTAFGLANLYIYHKVAALLPPDGIYSFLTGAVIVLLTLSPGLIHLLSFRSSGRLLKALAYISYFWVALLVLFLPLSLAVDLYNYLALSGLIGAGMQPLTHGQSFSVPVALAVLAIIYGYFEAGRLKVERIGITTSKLPAGTDHVTVVQISDFHLGITTSDRYLERIYRIIEESEPDIIVSTGDLVDGVVRHVNHFAEKLRQLRAREGKFAVLGNHEYFGGIRHAVEFIRECGFTLLNGEGVTIGGKINIAGIDDMAESRGMNSVKSERGVLEGLPRDLFTILLKHRPNVSRDSLGLFDLQLSGHTHSGQMFPIHLVTMFMFEYHSGYKKLSKGSRLYVSRGAGTGGPPVRLLSRPEVAVIRVVRG